MVSPKLEYPEVIYHSPYPHELQDLLDQVADYCITPYRKFLDKTLSCFFPTTLEKQKPHKLIHVYLLLMPVYFLCTLLAVPLALVGIVVWLSVHKHRGPYRYSESKIPGARLHDPDEGRPSPVYSFVTGNLCLMPECFSRYNNLMMTPTRAREIGRVIADYQLKSEAQDFKSCTLKPQLNGHVIPTTTFTQSAIGDAPFEHHVLTDFPRADFLLLQEASWQQDLALILGKELHRVYPHIVYDIAVHSWRGNKNIGGSGLMFASKYPILKVKFSVYSASCKQCALASKGLLQVKVDLGRTSSGKRMVGFIFNTHLQAYQGKRPIQQAQMSDVMQWVDEFRQLYLNEEEEVLVFDVFGGDLNLDNMSPVDRGSHSHQLFSMYRDLGRVRPGLDQPWARGTDLRQTLLYEPAISTPQGLAHVMSDDILMQTYFVDANIVNATANICLTVAERDDEGNVVPSPVGGRRRIDYVMPRQGLEVEVLGYNAVAGLATLTDHIPMALTLRVDQP